MANPINLDNVNISLQQFQDIASGKYNAGEVKLAGENKLAKMNNHVETWFYSNQEKIDHEEVLAIKHAFVKALSQNGVGGDEITKIRQELGLAPREGADRTLRLRNAVPLSRQLIREILDRNAATINSQDLATATRINTSSMIHAQATMGADAKAKRDAVNQKLASGQRSLRVNKAVGRFEAVIADSVGYADPEARAAMLGIAREQLDKLMLKCHCRPSATEPATALLPVPGGPSIEVPTGLSQKVFAERLENIIAKLNEPSGPDPAERELSRHYRGLGPAETQRAFLDGLANDPRGGWKARSLAVQALYDLGVADHDTLSLANRLSDADALALAKAVLALGRNASPEEVRANPAVAALAAKAPVDVRESGMVYVPALSAGKFNEFVRTAFANAPEKGLPRFSALAAEISNTVRTHLGGKGLPDGTSTMSMVDGKYLGPLLDCGPGAVRTTPETLREPLLRAALLTGAERIVAGIAKEEYAAAGREDGSEDWVANVVCQNHPELLERLAAAESPAGAAEIAEGFRADVRKTVARQIEARDARAGVEDRAYAAIAKLFGLPPEAAVAAGIQFDRLKRKAADLVHEIARGDKGPLTHDGVEKAFRDLVDNHAAALAGKTLVPFATSGGSGMGDSSANLQALAPAAKVPEGRRFRASASADELATWARGFR